MPQFGVLSVAEAQAKSVTGKRAQIVQEYTSYIESLRPGQAGQLQANQGETTSAIRRRLGAAAKVLGVQLVVRRAEDIVYFWVEGQEQPRRGRKPRIGA